MWGGGGGRALYMHHQLFKVMKTFFRTVKTADIFSHLFALFQRNLLFVESLVNFLPVKYDFTGEWTLKPHILA